MQTSLFYTCLFYTCYCFLFQSCNNEPANQSKNNKFTIRFTGDVILDRGVNDQIRLFGDSLLTNAFSNSLQADYTAINLEGTFTTENKKENNRYNFKTNPKQARLLKKNGVTHASVANNHSYDYGQAGFQETLNTLTIHEIEPLGNSCTPKMIQHKPYSCAILATSLTSGNDSFCIRKQTKLLEVVHEFSSSQPNIPFVLYIHWGSELQPTPESWQRELAAQLIKAGVDAIIGHHPHTVQTIEFIQNKPVLYSLGNFIADAYLPNTNTGLVAQLVIGDSIEAINVQPVHLKRYFPETVNCTTSRTILQKSLHYSTNIAALETNQGWLLKPIEQVNFKEPTTLWMLAGENSTTTIKRLQSGAHLLTYYTGRDTSNTICLHGELSEFRLADINHDNDLDLIVGITKKVNFDPVRKKRINVFTYQNHNLIPLWLGTKFLQDVKTFDIVQYKKNNYLTTIEGNSSEENKHRTYIWDNFGFALTNLPKTDHHEN